jgi:hypothetical protein
MVPQSMVYVVPMLAVQSVKVDPTQALPCAQPGVDSSVHPRHCSSASQPPPRAAMHSAWIPRLMLDGLAVLLCQSLLTSRFTSLSG